MKHEYYEYEALQEHCTHEAKVATHVHVLQFHYYGIPVWGNIVMQTKVIIWLETACVY